MKSSTIKNIIVQCGQNPETKKPYWKDEIEVDSEIFDDPLLEAATQSVEKRKNEPDFKVAVVIECFEKKNAKDPMKHICYNSYFIMVNAGLYEKAELLRLNFKKAYKTDLQKESIKGEADDGKPNTKSTKSTKSKPANNADKPELN
jgi:hypothetical protein